MDKKLIFKELIIHTSGDFDEAIDWLRELDKEYKLTDEDYTIDDFVNDLLNKGFVSQQIGESGDTYKISSKTERLLRKHVLKHLFGKLKKTKNDNHKTKYSSSGSDDNLNVKNFEFGDTLDKILLTESLKNAIISSGENDLTLKKEDIVVWDSNHNSQMSTVLMIDISHSMILYGEDRITPAKKVAMALVEYIKTKFPKDTIDILSFGDEAKPINIKLTIRENKISKLIAKDLKKENIFFAGIDFIDQKINGDINVTSPTGLRTLYDLSGINLAKIFWKELKA